MEIQISEDAKKTLSKLDKHTASKIINYIENLASLRDPTTKGKWLSDNLAGYYRYRVGDYRVICKIQKQKMLITVIKIGHRSTVYK